MSVEAIYLPCVGCANGGTTPHAHLWEREVGPWREPEVATCECGHRSSDHNPACASCSCSGFIWDDPKGWTTFAANPAS